MSTIPQLVAHRGYRGRYPENTLPGIEAAVAAGAPYVEFDVQLSADGVPVVLHDATLERTSENSGDALAMTVAELAQVDVGEPCRFGKRYLGTHISTLAETVSYLNQHPEVAIFVEAKRQSVERFGAEQVAGAIAAAMANARFPWALISFEISVLRVVRATYRQSIGWVMRDYDPRSLAAAEALAPEYLFVAERHLPTTNEPLWPGAWSWVIYGVDKIEQVLALGARGADLVETDHIGELLAHPAVQGMPGS